MKHMRKILALMLAVVMTLAMSVTAFASDDTSSSTVDTVTSYTITINGTDVVNSDVTHTYEAYQVFSGSISDGKLIGIEWGDGVDGDALLTALQGYSYTKDDVETSPFAACTTAEEVAKVLQDESNDSEVVQAFAAYAAENKATVAASADTEDMIAELTVDAVGYYLIMDQDDTLSGEDDSYTRYILRVVEDVTVVPKSSYPSVDKQVYDNDTDDATSEDNATNLNAGVDGFYESADHAINETFQFKLIATIPAEVDVAKYAEYVVTFQDTMSAGVTFESIDSVYVNTTEVSPVENEGDSGYTTDATEGLTGSTFYVDITDIKEIIPESEWSSDITITVIYSAHLNEDAVVSTESAEQVTVNNNKVYLEYSNNPNAAAGNTYRGETPEDYVFVFTYRIDNIKYYDEIDEEKILAGAEFQLLDADDNEVSLIWDDTLSAYRPIKDDETAETLTSQDDGTFPIVGVDAGSYTIHETKAPDGFNVAEDIAVTISAVHSEDDNVTTANLTLTETNTDNQIIDRSGATLPTTGGMGTTIFYVIGAVLVIGAGVVLVTRRRMNAQ